MRVLIADDDDVLRHILEATLAKWGYEVVVFNGRVVQVIEQREADDANAALSRCSVVLSGHGKAREWLLANAKLNQPITIPDSLIKSHQARHRGPTPR
jgi:DNA-binding NtrC family response regulator